jgi:preprotein translocase subunit YajC
MAFSIFVSDAIAADSTPAAATATATAATQQAGADLQPYELSAEKMMMDNLFILAMLFFIFYFILIRPQQKRLRVHQEMMKGLQKNDKIITTGGLIGQIVKFEGDDVVVVEISPNVRVRIARGSVSEVVTDKPGSSANDN